MTVKTVSGWFKDVGVTTGPSDSTIDDVAAMTGSLSCCAEDFVVEVCRAGVGFPAVEPGSNV